VCAGGEDSTARAWLVQMENSLATLKYTPENNITTLQREPEPEPVARVNVNAIDVYSPISPVSMIVTANEDGCVRAWDVSTRNFSTPLRWTQKVSLERLRCLKIYIPINYDEDIITSTSTTSSTSTVDNNTTKKSLAVFSLLAPMVLCAGRDKVIYFVDLFTGQLMDHWLTGHVGTITSLAISTTIEIPFVVSGSEEYEVKVWSIYGGDCLFDLKGHIFDVNAVAIYSPCCHDKESIIISGSVDSTIRLWEYGSTTQMTSLCAVDAPVNTLTVADFLATGPVIIAGSADATIKIWALTGGYKLLHTFTGHMDEVTCLSVYKGDGGCYDSLVSGSLDKCVIVWDLNKYQFVTRIEGHMHEVSSVCLFSTDFTDPSIASASTEVRILFDFKSNSTNEDYVAECFQFDMIQLNANMHNYKAWPRISKLVEQNGATYFLNRYCDLFRKAVEASRPDFLTTFMPMAESTVVKCITELNILKTAVALDQQESVRILVSCLIGYIEKGKCFEISPTKFPIHTDDLLLLAESYPHEFERLLCNLKLVFYSEDMRVGEDFLRQNCSSDGYDMDVITDSTTNASINSSVSYSFLPLPITAHMKLLSALCDVCDSTNHTSIFNSQAGLMILGYGWAKFGKKTHIKLMVVSYLYILLATFNVYCFEHFLLKTSYFATRFFLILQICFECWFSIPVIADLYRNWLPYCSSIWNQMRLIIIVGGLLGNTLRLYHMKELRLTRIVLSVTSIAMWFDALYYLRAFEGKAYTDYIHNMYIIICELNILFVVQY
jgi:WD40 repeat protein